MAKEKKVKNIEETLWDSANKLRGSVESAEYKHVVLGLIFLKFASDKFDIVLPSVCLESHADEVVNFQFPPNPPDDQGLN
jgi:type I restriction-modification system DNA methylase subunit